MTKPELRRLLSLELKQAYESLNLVDNEKGEIVSPYYLNLPTLRQQLKAIRKDSIELEKREYGYGYGDENDE